MPHWSPTPRFRRGGKRERRSWVGTRRVALPYVSSCPPLKTVRTTFMVYGLTPAVPLRVPTKRSFPLRQLHGAFPADSLRVRWGPLVRSFRRRGAFATSPHPAVHGFPTLRLLCPIRLCWRALAFCWGLPCLPSHSPSHPASSLPCSTWRTQPRWLRWHVPRGPVHAVWLPSTGIGSTGASRPPAAAPLLSAASASSPARGGVELDGLTQQVRCVRGSVSRRARRASGDAPSHLSAKHHLLAPSLRLMVSFRGMLLTLQSGLERLTPQAHRVPVYPTVLPHSDMSLHGARSGRWRQSAAAGCSVRRLVRTLLSWIAPWPP